MHLQDLEVLADINVEQANETLQGQDLVPRQIVEDDVEIQVNHQKVVLKNQVLPEKESAMVASEMLVLTMAAILIVFHSAPKKGKGSRA